MSRAMNVRGEVILHPPLGYRLGYFLGYHSKRHAA